MRYQSDMSPVNCWSAAIKYDVEPWLDIDVPSVCMLHANALRS